jgi:hypothetical protein
MLFAHLKRILKLNRLRLRGPKGARDEFLLYSQQRTFSLHGQRVRYVPEPVVIPLGGSLVHTTNLVYCDAGGGAVHSITS